MVPRNMVDRSCNLVILLVGQGIAVGIDFKFTQVKDLDDLVTLKELMVGDILEIVRYAGTGLLPVRPGQHSWDSR